MKLKQIKKDRILFNKRSDVKEYIQTQNKYWKDTWNLEDRIRKHKCKIAASNNFQLF